MANFSPGLVVGLDSSNYAAYEQTQIKRLKQEMDFSAFRESQIQQELEDQRKAREREEKNQTYQTEYETQQQPPQVSARPSAMTGQPPMPGQPSQPMQQQFGAQPSALQQSIQTPPSISPRWSPSPAAPQTLGGVPPGQMPPSPAPQVPPRPQQNIPPTQVYQSTGDFASWLMKKHPDMSLEQVRDAVRDTQPLRDRHNKEIMEQLNIEIAVNRAKEAAEKATRAALGGGGEKMTANIKDSIAAAGGDPSKPLDQQSPEVQSRVQKSMGKEVAKKGRFKGEAGGFSSDSSAIEHFGGAGKKGADADKEVLDTYSTLTIMGDGTWRTGLSRTKGGANLILAVDRYVPQKMKELGITPVDLGTNKAKRIAGQAALTQNSKDLAMLTPYVNMLDQNADILSGLAEKAIATNTPLANKTINWLRNNVSGNPDVAEYLAQVEIVKNEATRVISNPRLVGQMTDTARKEIESVINGNMTLAQTKQVLERIKNDGRRRLTTMSEQQTSLTDSLRSLGEKKPEGGGTKAKYVEIRTTADGRTLGKTADGKIEEIQ